jgi:hypothetical protein
MPSKPITPEPVLGSENAVLTPAQVERWRSSGAVVVDGVFEPELVDALAAGAAARFPQPGTADAEDVHEFGNVLVFPASDLPEFNRVTLHPRLLTALGQLLDVDPGELRLTQSDLWPKYGRTERSGGRYDNQDQRIHVDYPNHMLVHPPPWDSPAAVELILYLSDEADSGGSTGFVPREGPDDPAYRWPIIDSPGIGDLRWINDRDAAEAYLAEVRPEVAPWRDELYQREQTIDFTVGTVLFYRHDVWHRGRPLRPGARRLAHNMTFRRADCPWVDTLHKGWSWAMYQPDQVMERLVAEASVDQRSVLGFPPPGDRYWCDATVAAIEARYGPLGMDVAPYRDAMVS